MCVVAAECGFGLVCMRAHEMLVRTKCSVHVVRLCLGPLGFDAIERVPEHRCIRAGCLWCFVCASQVE
jgi:hypothetical protein